MAAPAPPGGPEDSPPHQTVVPDSTPLGPPLEGVPVGEGERPTRLDVGAVGCAMATVTVFAMVFGAAVPLSSLVLERTGASETAIGINTAMMSLGLLLTVGYAPLLAIRFGAWRLMAASGLVCAGALMLQGLIVDYWAWLIFRFVIGVTSGFAYVMSESWVNMLTPDRLRGRVMGVYATVTSMGFAIGPLALATVGSEGLLPFLLIAAVMVTCVLVSLPVRRKVPTIRPHAGASIRRFALLAPTIVIAIMAFAMMEGALMALMPLYGPTAGLNEKTAILAISVVLAGYMGPQIPIGWLAEKIGDRILLIVTAACGTLVSLAVPFSLGTPAFWVLLFLWGSCGAALYTLALVELGNRFTGHMLVTGNAAIGVAWGLGGIVGPSSMGAAMDGFGPNALPLAIACVFGGVLALAAYRGLTRGRPPRPT